MQQIIAICNQKGGCGKSTIAIHLACGFANIGYSVALVDADRQRSASKWVARAKETNMRQIPLFQTQRDSPLSALAKIKEQLIIVDTAGDFSEQSQIAIRNLCETTTLVIVPILATPLDIDGAHDLLTSVSSAPTRARVLTLLNKAKHNNLRNQARAKLGTYPFTLLTTSVYDRSAYAAHLGFGGSAFDLRKSATPRLEMETLVSEVQTYLSTNDHPGSP